MNFNSLNKATALMLSTIFILGIVIGISVNNFVYAQNTTPPIPPSPPNPVPIPIDVVTPDMISVLIPALIASIGAAAIAIGNWMTTYVKIKQAVTKQELTEQDKIIMQLAESLKVNGEITVGQEQKMKELTEFAFAASPELANQVAEVLGPKEYIKLQKLKNDILKASEAQGKIQSTLENIVENYTTNKAKVIKQSN
jgi:hypothetical protein